MELNAARRRNLLKLSKGELIKQSKTRNISFIGSKIDIVNRLCPIKLSKTNRKTKQKGIIKMKKKKLVYKQHGVLEIDIFDDDEIDDLNEECDPYDCLEWNDYGINTICSQNFILLQYQQQIYKYDLLNEKWTFLTEIPYEEESRLCGIDDIAHKLYLYHKSDDDGINDADCPGISNYNGGFFSVFDLINNEWDAWCLTNAGFNMNTIKLGAVWISSKNKYPINLIVGKIKYNDQHIVDSVFNILWKVSLNTMKTPENKTSFPLPSLCDVDRKIYFDEYSNKIFIIQTDICPLYYDIDDLMDTYIHILCGKFNEKQQCFKWNKTSKRYQLPIRNNKQYDVLYVFDTILFLFYWRSKKIFCLDFGTRNAKFIECNYKFPISNDKEKYKKGGIHKVWMVLSKNKKFIHFIQVCKSYFHGDPFHISCSIKQLIPKQLLNKRRNKICLLINGYITRLNVKLSHYMPFDVIHLISSFTTIINM